MVNFSGMALQIFFYVFESFEFKRRDFFFPAQIQKQAAGEDDIGLTRGFDIRPAVARKDGEKSFFIKIINDCGF